MMLIQLLAGAIMIILSGFLTLGISSVFTIKEDFEITLILAWVIASVCFGICLTVLVFRG